MQRFRVAEHSMLPELSPGDEFVASSLVLPGAGSVVALPHPERADFWLVKRVVEKPGVGLGLIWVESDSPSVPSVDSRTFGPVPVESALTRVDRLEPATFSEAAHFLAGEDAALAAVIDRFGVPEFWQRPAGFSTLTLLILEQQVSLESGAAVFQRLADLCGEVTPGRLAEVGDTRLRGIGVTRQKASYLVGLAEMVLAGELEFDALTALRPEAARAALLEIRGVGNWTADAYLVSALALPDVFPLGDRALQVGTMEVLGLEAPAIGEDLELLSRPWRPVRAVAARLIWHAYLSRRGRTEPKHATGPVI